MEFQNFKGKEGRLIKYPKLKSYDKQELTEDDLIAVKRFLRYKLEYVMLSQFTQDEESFVTQHLDSEVKKLQLSAIKNNQFFYKNRLYVGIATVIMVIFAFVVLLDNGDSGGGSEKLDCSNTPAYYDHGFAAGQTTYMMGSNCSSCCYLYVQKYNQTANSLIDANPCFCEGFKDGVISKRPN